MKKRKKQAAVYAFVEFMLSEMPGFAAEKLRASYMAKAREFLDSGARKEPTYSICGWCDAKFIHGYNGWFCSKECSQASYQEYLECDI